MSDPIQSIQGEELLQRHWEFQLEPVESDISDEPSLAPKKIQQCRESVKLHTSGIPKTAPRLATLTSQETAISKPAPSAYPFTLPITGTAHSRILLQASETLDIKLRAEAGESRRAISAISAPPTKAFGPAPVRIMQSRSLFWEVRELIVRGSWVRRGVLRAFSLVGREIVRWAIVPDLRWVRRVRIDIIMVDLIDCRVVGMCSGYKDGFYMGCCTENHRSQMRGRAGKMPRRFGGGSRYAR